MSENLNQIVTAAMAQPGRTHMRPVIEKELLHYDILFALSQGKLLDTLTFQGGTSLRLCHGSPRFSEDLDFAGGADLDSGHLKDIKQCLEDYLGGRYGLDVKVKEPRLGDLLEPIHDSDDKLESRAPHILVLKWQISITTAPKRPDLPRQRIKLEVASVPAYTSVIKSLTRNYEFLPDGYSDTLINVETLDEIMADKLVSLPACDRYVRHRDIWDLRWLKQQGARIDMDLITKKIEDYSETRYLDKLDDMVAKLDTVVAGAAFNDEMLRFIPSDVQARTLKHPQFAGFLSSEIKGLLTDVKGFINEDKPNNGSDMSFRM